jgi:hypothetical protein
MGLKAMHNAMRLKDRIARLESRAAAQSRPKKRAIPDWLQTRFEQDGYSFDIAGQIIGCPIDHFGAGERSPTMPNALIRFKEETLRNVLGSRSVVRERVAFADRQEESKQETVA